MKLYDRNAQGQLCVVVFSMIRNGKRKADGRPYRMLIPVEKYNK